MKKTRYIIKHNYDFYVRAQVLSVAKAHLDLVTQERSVYRDVCKTSRENLKSLFTMADGTFQPPCPASYTLPNSVKTTVHYSFDMAQQVHNTVFLHINHVGKIRSIFQVTHTSLGLYFFKLPENVAYSEYAAKLYLVRYASYEIQNIL